MEGTSSLVTKALAITSALYLTACSGGDISRLKAQAIASSPSFTIGQAFDHRNACAEVSWNESTDDRGRKVIEYRCTFKVDKSYYEKSQQAAIDQLNKAMSREQEGYESGLSQQAKTLDDRQKQEAAMESQLEQQSSAANPDALFLSHQIDRMKQDTASFTAEYQQKKANEQQALTQIQNNYQASIAKVKANGLITGATETFQWTVNDSGNTLIAGSIDIQTDNGKTSHQDYSDTLIDRAIDAIVRNEASDLPTYVRKVFVF
ncbi:hypothetical protein [Dyella sp. GSA-30]|uniref:hypothetical protein n=1 Tax=Dyella sp. GSA-30 TaxID=2994496 RepID=UPI0024935E39|nr:hypothetical protein [Dyella sp. GSA-30]BDU22256.1 hypothetical protein DYGSA30_37130 [Dyella sp. GSA-30]